MTPSLEAISAYIRTRLDGNPGTTQIAAHFGINRFALSRWFRAQTGLSLRDYIAALKIEQSIVPLVEGQSVIESQLQAGHASAATNSHRFRIHTGLAPSDYREQAAGLHRAMSSELDDRQTRILMHLELPANPQARPRTHRTYRRRQCTQRRVCRPVPRVAPARQTDAEPGPVSHAPDGHYCLLECEINPSVNPLHYFRLDHCLRAIYREPLDFPLTAPQTVHVLLRPLLPSDPPITRNMPKPVLDQRRGRGRYS